MGKLYGRGTVEEIVKGKKYRIQLPCGKDPITGKYVRVRETFLGTKRQAEMRIEEIRREIENGKTPNADKVTFGEWCERFLRGREDRANLRPQTLKHNRYMANHLLKYLGETRIVDITPMVVSEMYASMHRDDLGDSTIVQCHKLLKQIMDNALKNRIILQNPLDLLDKEEKPVKPEPHRIALNGEQSSRLATICASGTPTANKTAVFLGLALGARLGEILGLQWKHVAMDDSRPYIHILQQYTPEKKIGPLKTDKNGNAKGQHKVPIDTATVAVLQAWKFQQRENLLELGIEQGSDTPVITNAVGSWFDHSDFRRWWRAFCVDNGFGYWVDQDGKRIVTLTVGDDAALYPDCTIDWRDAAGWPCDSEGKRYSRSHKRDKPLKRKYQGLVFHELRHTHFSLRLASGMDIPTAQALGGWSTPSMLMNVYAHPEDEKIWASAGFMDALTLGK